MARARTLKPNFFASEQLAACSHLARLLFAGLWCIADREGKLLDRPTRIKAELFPYEPVPDVESQLAELAREGLILRYVVGAQRLIKVLEFVRHQNPHPRETPSELPEPCNYTASNNEDMLSPAGSSGSSGSSDPGSSSTAAGPRRGLAAPRRGPGGRSSSSPPRRQPYREPWQTGPRSDTWRDSQGRSLAEIQAAEQLAVRGTP